MAPLTPPAAMLQDVWGGAMHVDYDSQAYLTGCTITNSVVSSSHRGRNTAVSFSP